MTLFEMLSKKVFKLSGNIDERYFQKNDDGTYSATPLFIYNVSRNVASDIKRIILASKDPNYTTVSTNDGNGYDENDSWASHEHNAAWGVKYKTQIEAEAKLWKQYQQAHIDEFDRNKDTIATGDIPTTRFFSAFHFDFNGMSNAELMSMYKEAAELNKKYGDDLRETLPMRPGNLVSKPDFKAKHQADKAKIREKVGLPEDTWVCPTVHKDERVSILRSNSKAYKAITNADGSEFENYVNSLVDHLCSSTPEEHRKEWERLYTNIEDICDGLTRGGRGTKLVISRSNAKDAMNISIYTSDKSPDNPNRKRLANISKVNPEDDFYTFTIFMSVNGRRPVRQISTNRQLKEAFEDFIELLKFNGLDEYIDCVENAVNVII